MLTTDYKKHLVVFGTQNYENSINSLIKSAKNFFDEYHVFSLNDIDSDFLEKNKSILSQSRGAGYWLWKPYFLKKIMEIINYGDIVFYVDAGNIFINDPSSLYEKLNINDGIILFDNRDGMSNGESAKNYISCKKDSFVLMNCDSNEYVYGTHLNASYQIYQKNKTSVEFIDEYLRFCENEKIITDTPNEFGPNYPGYYDHRHDQSVLSLLAIKKNIKPLVDPSEWGNKCGERGFNQIFNHHRKPNYVL
jgi:hypothetical protein